MGRYWGRDVVVDSGPKGRHPAPVILLDLTPGRVLCTANRRSHTKVDVNSTSKSVGPGPDPEVKVGGWDLCRFGARTVLVYTVETLPLAESEIFLNSSSDTKTFSMELLPNISNVIFGRPRGAHTD